MSALPAGGYGGEPVTVQIYFQFEGNATPEAVDRMVEQDVCQGSPFDCLRTSFQNLQGLC